LRSGPSLLLWSVQFVSLVAGYFHYVAVAWLALQLTGSALVVGSVLAAASVPQAVLMLLGGAVSDRFSPRNTMLGAGLARGVVMGVLGTLTLTHSVQLWQLFAAGVAPATSDANPLGPVREGVLHVWRDVPLRATLLVVAALNFFALGAVEVGLPALAHLRFSQGAVALGSAFAAWGLGSTLGSI